jgi:hypothetical protein
MGSGHSLDWSHCGHERVSCQCRMGRSLAFVDSLACTRGLKGKNDREIGPLVRILKNLFDNKS